MVSHLRPKMKVKKEVVAKECIDVFLHPLTLLLSLIKISFFFSYD